MKALLPILLCFISLKVFGQAAASLNFIPMWQGKIISGDSVFLIGNSGDSLRVSALRFYVYNIQFESENKVVWSSGDEHFLIDAFEKDGAKIPTKLSEHSKVDHLSFTIGVDSTLQTAGAHSGALDPIHGMYWAWQSGYIAWKFEAEQISLGQSNRIQWHIGGFRAPCKTQRTIRLKLNVDWDALNCSIQLDQLLSDWQKVYPAEVMSPNNSAMLLANRFQTCFKILPR